MVFKTINAKDKNWITDLFYDFSVVFDGLCYFEPFVSNTTASTWLMMVLLPMCYQCVTNAGGVANVKLNQVIDEFRSRIIDEIESVIRIRHSKQSGKKSNQNNAYCFNSMTLMKKEKFRMLT